jgi:hypothetical protein
MVKKLNWNWPQTRNNNLLPWYMILKNMVAVPFILIGIVFGVTYITFIGIAYLIVKGWDFAQEWVKDELYGSGVY